MELLSQKIKSEMEECKRRARAVGLEFQDNTLEYIVSNQDMLELSPKIMIPTLYDYWVDDLEVIKNKWVYDAYPHNLYETVINTRPAISFYNQGNSDWLNVMIFYHVLAHIDFFQNNAYFGKTWDDDFCGQALADKRLINRIREELGAEKRWVDYVIEFAKAIDNLVGYYPELDDADRRKIPEAFGMISEKIDFYFGKFLKKRYEEKAVELKFYYGEIERYNRCLNQCDKERVKIAFFGDNYFRSKFPEFNDVFKKWKERERERKLNRDIFEHLLENSKFLNEEKNMWMKDVLQVIRRTSLYFQPQIRTKICNEGWASFWDERLFIPDERIKTHEVDYAKSESGVSLDVRVGLNPYAFGKHFFSFIEDMARKGKFSLGYQLQKNIDARKHYDQKYDQKQGEDYAKKILFESRKYLNDYLLINFLSDEDFQDFVDKYKLWIVGVRPSRKNWQMVELYIKSKSGKEYRRLLDKNMCHPPYIKIMTDDETAKEGELYLCHVYEGRSLFTKYIPTVLIGLEFFWGKRVKLETTEYERINPDNWQWWYPQERGKLEYKKVRVLYTCENRKVERKVL